MGKSTDKSTKEAPVKAAKTVAKKQSGDKSSADLILELLGKNYARGVTDIHKDKIAAQLKIAVKTVANTLTKLKKDKLVTVLSGNVSLTDEGVEDLGELAKQPGTDEEIHEKLKEGLSKKEAALFDLISDGEVYEKEVIARKLEYKDGKRTKAFMNLIGAMKKGKNILIYPDKDHIQLNHDVCFLPPKQD